MITPFAYRTDKSKVNVDIAGITCPIKSLADDKIICETEPRKPPTKTKIKITVGTQGIATQVLNRSHIAFATYGRCHFPDNHSKI